MQKRVAKLLKKAGARPLVEEEYRPSLAAQNPEGMSFFQLDINSSTPAAVHMMRQNKDDVIALQ